MKITVLGRGNAGCLTALHFGYYTRNRKDISIELIYDPNIPPEKVGQASILGVPQLLWESLGVNWYDNPIDATPKFGVLYENWGKKNDKIFASPFPLSSVALHYCPRKLQETILKSGYFDVEEGHIDNYDELDSDYIFDCRGKPDVNWNDYNKLISPVNSVILGNGKSKECDVNWTRAVATPDGWTFVIPNTTKTTSYGYLYNDEITPLEEASANFNKLFDFDNLKISTGDNFKFQQYVSKTPIDGRVILGGNRLFFLEPLEATGIATYLWWARQVWDCIIDDRTSTNKITSELHTYTNQLQNFLLWHYQYGSKYDTPFWEVAGKLKFEDPIFDRNLEQAKRNSMVDLRSPEADRKYDLYAQWWPWNFKYWHEAMTKDINSSIREV
jgi:hypothetical protein